MYWGGAGRCMGGAGEMTIQGGTAMQSVSVIEKKTRSILAAYSSTVDARYPVVPSCMMSILGPPES